MLTVLVNIQLKIFMVCSTYLLSLVGDDPVIVTGKKHMYIGHSTLVITPPTLNPVLSQGDNDPVDVVEIGSSALAMGGVYRVKPLGVYAMIDDGELDWKIIAISEDDPKAAKVNDVEDVER